MPIDNERLNAVYTHLTYPIATVCAIIKAWEDAKAAEQPVGSSHDLILLLGDFAAINYELGYADANEAPTPKGKFSPAARQAAYEKLRAALERASERESGPLTGDERHALIVEIIGAVDGLLAKDAVVSRDFLRYWQAYSGDIAKRILSALLERFDIRRRGSDHE